MLIDFNGLSEIKIPNMNGGEGQVFARMDVNGCGRFIQTIIPPKCSIGNHLQETNDDINFIVSGEGIAISEISLKLINIISPAIYKLKKRINLEKILKVFF